MFDLPGSNWSNFCSTRRIYPPALQLVKDNNLSFKVWSQWGGRADLGWENCDSCNNSDDCDDCDDSDDYDDRDDSDDYDDCDDCDDCVGDCDDCV